MTVLDSAAAARRGDKEPTFGFSAEEVNTILRPIYARGDRLMKLFISLHCLIALVLASFYDTWPESLIIAAAAAALFFVPAALQPGSPLTRSLAGISLQTFCALHIYQMHGMAEMHFFFFTSLTMMVVYQDWRSLWPGALLIIAQHILFALMTNSGVQLYFFEQRFVSVTKLTFHFGIALAHVGLCGYWAWILFRQTLKEAFQQAQLGRSHALLEEQLERVQRSETQITELNERLQGAMVETHHRVKNNLQIVAAMIELRVMEENEINKQDFVSLGMSVRALATVHDTLTHQAKAAGQADHVSARDLLLKLLPMLAGAASNRRIRYQVDDACLSSRQGASLALVTQELVSNALKHSAGEVEVSFAVRDGQAHLAVHDEGAGFPNGFDPGVAGHTGLELVENLSRTDLGGYVRYETRPEGGGRVVVTTPLLRIA